jgi:hypothetical protein
MDHASGTFTGIWYVLATCIVGEGAGPPTGAGFVYIICSGALVEYHLPEVLDNWWI